MSRVIYAVTVEIDPRVEAEWLPWYREQHVRDVLRQPGFLRARHLRDVAGAVDGRSRWVCHYEIESHDAFARYDASPEAAWLREDYQKRFGDSSRLSRQVLVEAASFEGSVP